MIYHKTQPEICSRRCHLPRACTLFLVSIWQGFKKLAPHHQNCCGSFWHLTVLVPTMASFTLWCDPLEILLWLSHSLWEFLTGMWHIVKIFCGWPINYYPWSYVIFVCDCYSIVIIIFHYFGPPNNGIYHSNGFKVHISRKKSFRRRGKLIQESRNI